MAVWGRTCRWFHGPWWQGSATATRQPKGYDLQDIRKVLGIAVGESEPESFWRQCLRSIQPKALKRQELGLTGTRLVISDAYLGLTAAIRRMFQASSLRRTARFAALRSLCRVHILRKLLSQVPKAGQAMVAAAM